MTAQMIVPSRWSISKIRDRNEYVLNFCSSGLNADIQGVIEESNPRESMTPSIKLKRSSKQAS